MRHSTKSTRADKDARPYDLIVGPIGSDNPREFFPWFTIASPHKDAAAMAARMNQRGKVAGRPLAFWDANNRIVAVCRFEQSKWSGFGVGLGAPRRKQSLRSARVTSSSEVRP